MNTADVRRWHELTRQIKELRDRSDELARERATLTRVMYDEPGVTYRALADLLGVSAVTINKIMHRGDPKPGSRTP